MSFSPSIEKGAPELGILPVYLTKSTDLFSILAMRGKKEASERN